MLNAIEIGNRIKEKQKEKSLKETLKEATNQYSQGNKSL